MNEMLNECYKENNIPVNFEFGRFLLLLFAFANVWICRFGDLFSMLSVQIKKK